MPVMMRHPKFSKMQDFSINSSDNKENLDLSAVLGDNKKKPSGVGQDQNLILKYIPR